MVGLIDQVLKSDIFQNYLLYDSIDGLRAKCSTYEAAVRDVDDFGRNSGRQGAPLQLVTAGSGVKPAVAPVRPPPPRPAGGPVETLAVPTMSTVPPAPQKGPSATAVRSWTLQEML